MFLSLEPGSTDGMAAGLLKPFLWVFFQHLKEFFPNDPGSLWLYNFYWKVFPLPEDRGSERAHYRGLGWSQIISFKWDGKETVVRPDAPPRWDRRENRGSGREGGARAGREQTHRGVPEKKSWALQACGEELVGIPGHGVSPGVGRAKQGQPAPSQAAQLEPPHPFQISSKRGFGLTSAHRRIPKSDV